MIKKTAIALSGTANKGKSETINEICTLLDEQYKDNSSYKLRILEQLEKDIVLIISIDSFKIGIISKGDIPEDISTWLLKFREDECDIIICATRTRRGTVEEVNALYPEYDIIWATPYFSNEKNHSELNALAAKHIVDMVNVLKDGQLGHFQSVK